MKSFYEKDGLKQTVDDTEFNAEKPENENIPHHRSRGKSRASIFSKFSTVHQFWWLSVPLCHGQLSHHLHDWHDYWRTRCPIDILSTEHVSPKNPSKSVTDGKLDTHLLIYTIYMMLFIHSKHTANWILMYTNIYQ